MHVQAYDGFAWMLAQTGIDPQGGWRVLDVGGADVNGTVHGQLPNAAWTVLDAGEGPGVDIVADVSQGDTLIDGVTGESDESQIAGRWIKKPIVH